MRLKQSKNKAELIERGKVLARVKVKKYSKCVIRLADWKALVKGKGYGKELMKRFLRANPDVYHPEVRRRSRWNKHARSRSR